MEREVWRSHLLCFIVKSQWKFDLFCLCTPLEKLGICHVRRPVSRDRRILVMEMEAGKATLVACSLLMFLYSKYPFLVWVFILSKHEPCHDFCFW